MSENMSGLGDDVFGFKKEIKSLPKKKKGKGKKRGISAKRVTGGVAFKVETKGLDNISNIYGGGL